MADISTLGDTGTQRRVRIAQTMPTKTLSHLKLIARTDTRADTHRHTPPSHRHTARNELHERERTHAPESNDQLSTPGTRATSTVHARHRFTALAAVVGGGSYADSLPSDKSPQRPPLWTTSRLCDSTD